jgi:hypothetical protein
VQDEVATVGPIAVLPQVQSKGAGVALMKAILGREMWYERRERESVEGEKGKIT